MRIVIILILALTFYSHNGFAENINQNKENAILEKKESQRNLFEYNDYQTAHTSQVIQDLIKKGYLANTFSSFNLKERINEALITTLKEIQVVRQAAKEQGLILNDGLIEIGLSPKIIINFQFEKESTK